MPSGAGVVGVRQQRPDLLQHLPIKQLAMVGRHDSFTAGQRGIGQYGSDGVAETAVVLTKTFKERVVLVEPVDRQPIITAARPRRAASDSAPVRGTN